MKQPASCYGAETTHFATAVPLLRKGAVLPLAGVSDARAKQKSYPLPQQPPSLRSVVAGDPSGPAALGVGFAFAKLGHRCARLFLLCARVFVSLDGQPLNPFFFFATPQKKVGTPVAEEPAYGCR